MQGHKLGYIWVYSEFNPFQRHVVGLHPSEAAHVHFDLMRFPFCQQLDTHILLSLPRATRPACRMWMWYRLCHHPHRWSAMAACAACDCCNTCSSSSSSSKAATITTWRSCAAAICCRNALSLHWMSALPHCSSAPRPAITAAATAMRATIATSLPALVIIITIRWSRTCASRPATPTTIGTSCMAMLRLRARPHQPPPTRHRHRPLSPPTRRTRYSRRTRRNRTPACASCRAVIHPRNTIPLDRAAIMHGIWRTTVATCRSSTTSNKWRTFSSSAVAASPSLCWVSRSNNSNSSNISRCNMRSNNSSTRQPSSRPSFTPAAWIGRCQLIVAALAI